MRSVLVRTSNSVILHSVAAEADRALFEKRAQVISLHKASKPAIKTRVGKYVDRRTPLVSRKIERVLKAASKRIAAQVLAVYEQRAQKLAKDASIDAQVKAILDELELEGVSAQVIEQITPDLIRAFKDAGILGVGQVGIGLDDKLTDHLDEKALEWAEARGGQLIKDLAGTTRDDMQSLLARGVEEGMSSQELADAIEEMGAFGPVRAEMIARTELAFAHVQGNKEGWRATGEVVGKRSILGDLHDIDDECDECADAGVVGLDDEFIPGYSDPPYHPRCLCTILPILSGEDDAPTESTDEGDEE